MIKVTFYQRPDNTTMRCIFEGHAGYDDSGEDIVCSAVSILYINTVNSIEKLTGDPYRLDAEDSKNRYDFSFTEEPTNAARLLMDSLLLGLTTISDQYGSEYLKITLKEVQ